VSLGNLIIVSAHNESSGVILGAVWWVTGPVLAYVDHVCGLAVLNRKLELLLLILIHRRRIHRVISESQWLRLSELRSRVCIKAISNYSTLLA
jgi:uncharacterized membrane protein